MKPSLSFKVLVINQTGFRPGNTVRLVSCLALCTGMLLLVMATGCSISGGSRSWIKFSAVTDTEESVFLRRRDLADGGHYVEHPLLEQWKRHLNGRGQSTFTGWTSKENIMRMAGTQTRPTGRHLQPVPQNENANAYRNAWNPAPLSMYLLTGHPESIVFDSVLPLEYPLKNLAGFGFTMEDQSRETTGTVPAPFGGMLNRTRGSNQKYMELVFPIFGISLLICVLLTPVLCSIGAQYIANPIRGSPHLMEAAEMTITDQYQETVAFAHTWPSDVLVCGRLS